VSIAWAGVESQLTRGPNGFRPWGVSREGCEVISLRGLPKWNAVILATLKMDSQPWAGHCEAAWAGTTVLNKFQMVPASSNRFQIGPNKRSKPKATTPPSPLRGVAHTPVYMSHMGGRNRGLIHFPKIHTARIWKPLSDSVSPVPISSNRTLDFLVWKCYVNNRRGPKNPKVNFSDLRFYNEQVFKLRQGEST